MANSQQPRLTARSVIVDKALSGTNLFVLGFDGTQFPREIPQPDEFLFHLARFFAELLDVRFQLFRLFLLPLPRLCRRFFVFKSFFFDSFAFLVIFNLKANYHNFQNLKKNYFRHTSSSLIFPEPSLYWS